MNLSNYVLSLVRTAVPAGVGAVLAWLAVHGLDVPAGDRAQLAAAGTVLAGVAYYALVRWLESRWPKLGILLGAARVPTYTAGESVPEYVVRLVDAALSAHPLDLAGAQLPDAVRQLLEQRTAAASTSSSTTSSSTRPPAAGGAAQ